MAAKRGIAEPQATFSACFGQPFLPLSATVYAKMLGDRLSDRKTPAYLVNTGWSGGAYGVGSRIPIKYTRAMVNAALDGHLKDVKFYPHPILQVLVPEAVPGVPSEILDPRNTWSDKAAYDLQAEDLAKRFVENFKRYKTACVEIVAAGFESEACLMMER